MVSPMRNCNVQPATKHMIAFLPSVHVSGWTTPGLRNGTHSNVCDVVIRRERTRFPAATRTSIIPSENSTFTRSTPRMDVKVGDRVRIVAEDIVMYHLPGHRNEPIEMTGKTGVVTKDVSFTKDGFKVSATSPFLVALDDFEKGSAHFAAHELEVISEAES